MVFDQVTGQPVIEAKAHKRFRSASLVKLLIALDYLQTRDPDSGIPAEDLALLESMLRSSDDTAASILWVRGGFEEIIARMVPRLGLTDTAPPMNRRIWGYTAVSAADVVKIYRYILDKAAPHIRHFMLSNLSQATQCATDGFDQYFGIPKAVPRPWAIKQGWSGYGAMPPPGQECQPSQSEYSENPLALLAAKDAPAALLEDLIAGGAESEIDLTRPAMHTSGVIDHDNKIIVVLSLQPMGTSWQDSSDRVTAVTRALYLASRAVTIPDVSD
ncbi:MAG: class A beta-lactamase-related serine hydrolase [Actinobacteria bacterium]|nr:class A beta-lactamase-related serine hydrolase [Actinomycetota bacterium]